MKTIWRIKKSKDKSDDKQHDEAYDRRGSCPKQTLPEARSLDNPVPCRDILLLHIVLHVDYILHGSLSTRPTAAAPGPGGGPLRWHRRRRGRRLPHLGSLGRYLKDASLPADDPRRYRDTRGHATTSRYDGEFALIAYYTAELSNWHILALI